MNWNIKSFVAATAAVVAMSSANAGVVKVWGESPFGVSLQGISDFYDDLPVHTSSVASGQLDTVNLTGVNLLWAVQPSDAYTVAELNVMANFLAGGGRIAFMGEHGSIAPNENVRINSALTFLGSTIQIQNTIVDGGFRTASVLDGQILAHPLTTGVNTYQYAAFAPLLLSGSAEALMLGEAPNTVMMAYQNIGPGSIFLITDQNVFDNAPTWSGSFDNARMFENLLSGNTGAPPVNGVPEPAGALLFGLALLSVAASRRHRA
ncbi:MAG: hypothetical protein RIS44_790 [Pseudomonadota bacterium]|jgi:hypothetical protein